MLQFKTVGREVCTTDYILIVVHIVSMMVA